MEKEVICSQNTCECRIATLTIFMFKCFLMKFIFIGGFYVKGSVDVHILTLFIHFSSISIPP